ncbi:putative competence-damage inducible protein [Symmachiella macrocystis]|uniref:CinA-like protein n=1 Tax=Symmachiella macrocystis TaxID=2527985 RepID=A0A5C6B3Q9_9PLAN|nr:CinA family nicotinamide mononucleotide deamidase-related protein [Symmachiella macrocystis]TWU06793.1 putative competence-damage inducible protein [Symmachiella macrocystis]
MHAEIISIGSELTTGAKLDTNSQWLSRELAGIGIPVYYHTTVADDLAANADVLATAVSRADVVLITGGLGPTQDDLTREALAEMLAVPLELDEPSLEFIQGLFASRNREMPERNSVQAMFPRGTQPIPNHRGTAPGIWAEIPRDQGRSDCKLAAMPGVPSEMYKMFQQQVVPKLQNEVGPARYIRSARINCFGPGESQAEQWLAGLTARGRDPEIGITVSKATITLRITAHGASSEECECKIQESKTLIYERMGQSVFGEEDQELQHVVIDLLAQQNQTLATAESGTGGLLAHHLTEIDALGLAYLGGIVAPTDSAKTDLLAVPAEVLAAHGPISGEVAEAMAVGCRTRLSADYALAVTECPASAGDIAPETVPCAYIALASDSEAISRRITLGGDPGITKARVAKAALNLLRLSMTGGLSAD